MQLPADRPITTSLRVRPSVRARLSAIAYAQGQSLVSTIDEALEAYLRRREKLLRKRQESAR